MVKLFEILKAGEVSSIDPKNGKVRVLLLGDDEKTTDWLNILVPYSESHSDNYILKVGQTVYCLFFPEFPEQGVVIGCPMRGGVSGEGEVRRTFSDSGFYSYNNGVLTLNPIFKVVINANTEINGNLTVSGTTITGGNINLNTHKHSGVTAGGDKTGGPQ